MEKLNVNGLHEVALVDRNRCSVQPGDWVRLTACHHHCGSVGRYEGSKRSMGLWGASVRFDDGTCCLVFRACEWERCNGV